MRAREGEQAVRPNQRQSQARQVGAVLRKRTAAEAVLVPAAQTLGSAARWVCQVSEIPLRLNLPWCCLTGVRMNRYLNQHRRHQQMLLSFSAICKRVLAAPDCLSITDRHEKRWGPSVRTNYSMSSTVQMHPDVRVSDPTFRPVLLARLFVCVTYPACRSLGWIQSISKPGPRTPLKESNTRDQHTIAQKSLDVNVIHARPMLQWALPRKVIYKKKDCPSYDAKCIESLHQVTCLVASGKIREPATIAIELSCPDRISFESMAIGFFS